MKHTFIILSLIATVLCGCAEHKEETPQGLQGAWTITKKTYPMDEISVDYPQNGYSYCLIFDEDSVYYSCHLQSTASGIIVTAGEKGNYELRPAGNNSFIFLQDGELRPLTFPNDSTLVLQNYGVKYTYVRNTEMSEQRIDEIRSVVTQAASNPDNEVMRYVLSTTEKELQTTNHRLAYSLIALLLAVTLVLQYTFRTLKQKKHIERQLVRIREEHELRPQPVAQALQQVETDFFASDYYLTLQHNIVTGKNLSRTDWQELEEHCKTVFPDFLRDLSALCKMSVMEWRVCLLIKLKFSPSEIANALCKETSTISSTRSRLYKKIFDKQGSTKDWDNFILSL